MFVTVSGVSLAWVDVCVGDRTSVHWLNIHTSRSTCINCNAQIHNLHCHLVGSVRITNNNNNNITNDHSDVVNAFCVVWKMSGNTNGRSFTLCMKWTWCIANHNAYVNCNLNHFCNWIGVGWLACRGHEVVRCHCNNVGVLHTHTVSVL